MFAPQRRHEDVKFRKPVEKALFSAVFCRQHVEKRRRLIVEEKLAGTETEIQIRTSVDFAPYNLLCGSGRH